MVWAVVAMALAVALEYSAFAEEPFSPIRDTRIVVDKGNQTLELFRNGHMTAKYRVCLGKEPRGPKRIIGDGKTPEGDYFICTKSTASRYCRFLGISYPGEKDAQTAFESGLISVGTRDEIISRVGNGEPPPWNTKLGGWVGIHGYATDEHRSLWVSLFYPKPHNWTDGCIALWNFEIEELFSRVSVGTRVTILP
jgi:murein L,D-transpeptidase YafK